MIDFSKSGRLRHDAIDFYRKPRDYKALAVGQADAASATPITYRSRFATVQVVSRQAERHAFQARRADERARSHRRPAMSGLYLFSRTGPGADDFIATAKLRARADRSRCQ